MTNSDAALLVFAIPGLMLAVWALITVRHLHKLEREIAASKAHPHPAE
jgi:hypothetical protein